MTFSIDENDCRRCPESKDFPVVGMTESVARLLDNFLCDSSGQLSPSGFQERDLNPVTDKSGTATELDCGGSAGVSVQRLPPADHDAIRLLAAARTAGKPAAVNMGAALASVQALREIRVQEIPGQVVFILADGSTEDAGHAVIRVHPDARSGLFKKVRMEIMNLFRQKILRPADA